MKYAEALDFMEQIGKYGIVPGLEGIRELCRRLGDPQRELRFVHVAGTNGKGSVCAYMSAVLQCGGYRVGKYTSPAVLDWREEIQVNGSYIAKAAVGRYMEQLKAVCGEMAAEGRPHPTPFEVKTAMAFLYFRDKKCDIVVMETGMGGLLDATNMVEDTCVAVLTSVSMDHMGFLGKTLPEIAAQKAGIIKRGCHVVTAVQEPEVMEVLAGRAAALGCPLTVADARAAEHVRFGLEKQRFDYGGLKKLEITLAGQCQIENAVTALEGLRALGIGALGGAEPGAGALESREPEAGCLESREPGIGAADGRAPEDEEPGGRIRKREFPVTEEKLRQGMAQAAWPGRFAVAGRKPCFILDGAHNEDAARKLAQSLELYFSGRRILYIMGMLRDKEYGKVIELTHSLADQIITVTPPGNPRAMPAYELAAAVAQVHEKVTAADSLEEAVEMARLLADKEDVIVAFGSLSYLGRMLEIVGGGIPTGELR
ncbi:bifunctional folylpolyglutamate synthase/dihydrofolate synthase [Acetatifactor aquisgranensis]|uniref:bifunctional folylpolyglutamate synthase/dihydrofolate synthase n=1 Tax=Acetatifactor aquisgranensis TaxID=2941233 RepID=UPI00203FCE9F|nr:folylpolyglutamate synthase/dihydrofolate synthase family protein [Acetatifactor aquisgranensis]